MFERHIGERVKGEVLGPVDHYYWKEYQARGAPHYHTLLWINVTVFYKTHHFTQELILISDTFYFN